MWFFSVTGGVEIQRECHEFIKRNDYLLPAQLYVSKSGRLPCKAIIHAVGPVWSSGHNNEKNLLYETVFNVLEAADGRGFTSIALPAISTGIYRFPVKLATTVILQAIENFLKQPLLTQTQKLREVHIIDQNTDVIAQFCKTAVSAFEDVDDVTVVHAPASDASFSKVAASSLSQTSKPGDRHVLTYKKPSIASVFASKTTIFSLRAFGIA